MSSGRARVARAAEGVEPCRLDAPPRRRGRDLSLTAGVTALVVFACLSLIAIEAWRTWSARAVELHEAMVNTGNLARSVAQQAEDTMEIADSAVLVSVESVELGGTGAATTGKLRQFFRERIALSRPRLRGLAIIDEAEVGVIDTANTLPTRSSYLDRPFFTYHRTHADLGPYVSAPMKSRFTGTWIFTVSRRIDHADGSFAGVAVASMDLSYFENFYDTFDIGKKGSIVLLRDDGTLLVRRPRVESAIGMSRAREGLFSQALPRAAIGERLVVSQTDGITRLTSYRRLDSYPLVVTVALSRDEVLALWRKDAWLHLMGALVLSGVASWLGFRLSRQIGRRLEAERAAAAASDNYRLLADNSTDMIVRASPDGIRRYVSPACRNMLGFEPEELVATSALDFIHPDDVAVFQSPDGSPRPAELTYRIRRKDGSYVWVESVGHPLASPAPDGRPEIVVAVRDISRRKAAEARLVDAVESIDDGFVLWDEDWRFVMCNSRYRELYALSAEYLVPGTSLEQIQRGGMRNGQYGPIDDPETFFAEQLSGPSRSGQVFERRLADRRWILGSNQKMTAGGWVGIRTDITEQKQREHDLSQARHRLEAQALALRGSAEALSLARDEAERANRVKSEFLANMSHEIRTPMNGVIGMNGLLLRTALSGEQRGFAEAVRRSAETLLRLIDDILDVSKLEAGKVTLEEIDFGLEAVLEDAVEVVAPRAHEKGLEVVSWLDGAAGRPLKGDPTRLRQVVLNLLSNAVKFTAAGFVAVEARTLGVAAGRRRLRLEVHDTGIGLDEAAKRRLFRTFEQADGSITRRFGGTGLGLSISKQLVELMGGRIGVSDRPGGGTIFWVELALAEGAALPAAAAADLPAGLRVLVVDDLAVNRTILSWHLGGAGAVVSEAATAAAAEAALAAAAAAGQPFAAVLLDQVMPEEPAASCAGPPAALPADGAAGGMAAGEALAERIRGRPGLGAPKLVLVSSDGAPGGGRAALFDAVLVKPVRHQALLRCLAGLCGGTARAADAAAAPAGRREARLLLAEDDRINREIAETILREAGYRVASVTDGRQAVAAAAAERFDLILMDVQMPVLDGLSATRAIRRAEPAGARVPILAMTANAMQGDRERCLAAGMDDHVTKPIELDAFLATVARWLDRGAAPPAAPAAAAAPVLDGAALDALERLITRPRLAELIGLYRREAAERMIRIAGFAARADREALAREAHDLKSTSGNFGARQAQMLAETLEQACRDADPAHLAAVVRQVEAAITEAADAIARRYPQPAAAG